MGSVTLWAGEDHLMLVELRGFTETYRRFYFKDVQTIVIRPTGRARTWSILLGLVTLALAGIAAGAEPGWNIFWGSLAGLSFVALVVNLALGQSSDCTLRTALQAVELRSLRRLRRARGVVDRLRPLIELEQGALAGEDLAARAMEATAPAAPPAPLRPPIVGPNRPLRHETGKVHEVLAYVLLLSAVVVVVPVLYFNILLNAALSVVFLGRIGCIVAALARQNHSDLPLDMKRFAWTALGWECVMMALGFVYTIIVIVQLFNSGMLDPGSATPPSPMAIMDLMKNKPEFKIMALLSSVASLALGIWGLAVHRRPRPAGEEPWQTLSI